MCIYICIYIYIYIYIYTYYKAPAAPTSVWQWPVFNKRNIHIHKHKDAKNVNTDIQTKTAISE